MTYRWDEWLKDWREIAEQSDATTYVPIMFSVGGTAYEVLRVSRFHKGYDGKKAHVETPIREFGNKVALHSRATRDLGIVRVITSIRKPTFVIEPGADVLEWLAAVQGVPVSKLVSVMRVGTLGRRVRSRDRTAAKNSLAQLEAERAEIKEELTELRERAEQLKALERDLERLKAERDSAIIDRNRMQDNLIRQNAEQSHGTIPLTSGTQACALGKAQEKGIKITSTKPMPGNYEG